MNLDKNLTQRSANRKRKSSLANVLQPIQTLKKPVLYPFIENEQGDDSNELHFEPTTLPDSSLTDLFNNDTVSPELSSSTASEKKLAFPIFTKQFIEHHRSQESEVQKIVSHVNHSRKQTKLLQRKNAFTVQQGQAAERNCRELRANNAQIKDYLRNFRAELIPLMSQLEIGLGNSVPSPNNPEAMNHLAFTTTQDLVSYLKDLGRRIWEFGADDDFPVPTPLRPVIILNRCI
ncbi:hypothetical protein DSO57_1032062 [Entomophthora muscae]|nr:hypothetical protein DSO57_1032062 [Entomophthora muscae]